MGSPGLPAYLLCAALLVISAFFSATEMAFSSVNMLRLRTMAEYGDKKAALAVHIAEKQWQELITTVLIGNNIVNIALSSLVTMMSAQWFGSYAVAAATGISTLVVLTFGEIIPKSFARDCADRWVLAVAGTMSFLIKLFTPLSWFFIKLDSLLHKKRGEAERQPTMTEQEFLSMLDTIEEDGVLEEHEKELVESAVQFYDSTVQGILTPRVNVVAIDVDDSREEILSAIREERYSRIPVYEDTIDNIIGVVQARDVLETELDGGGLDLRALMAAPMYIHRTMKVSKLLSEFQRNKTHLAVVIDDYGGTLGIVTMEDLLEELVGEIWDEDEEIVKEWEQLPDGSYEISGDTDTEDFFEHLGYEPDEVEDDWQTMNGWAMDKLEHIPHAGESFVCGPLSVKITEVDEQKINKMQVRYTAPDQQEQD